MQIVLIIVIFLAMCILMYTKKLNAMFALPIMALFIAIVAGIPWGDTAEGAVATPGIQTLLLVEGPVRLASTMITFIFGGILSEFVKSSGIAETIVRKVSELAGDRPLILSLAFYVVLCLLFTTLSGLGAVIMLGSIVLPIMVSVGVSSLAAGCILLFSLSVGGIFNLANWSLYIDSMGIAPETVRGFAWFAGAVFFVMGVLFIIAEVKFGGLGTLFKKKGAKPKMAWPLPEADAATPPNGKKVRRLALLTPFVPLVAVVGFGLDINAGFILAILYCFMTTISGSSLQKLTRAVIEGISNTAGALFLLVGIGMLLKVVMDSRVTGIIGPAMSSILPSGAILYVIFFVVLAPLALYRGPLNIWGLGLGLGVVMLSTGKLGASGIMAALMTTGQVQGICDPTNTHNVWAAASTGTDVNDIMKKTLPYVWVGVVIGLVVAAFLYF